jgi:hypothetical protein
MSTQPQFNIPIVFKPSDFAIINTERGSDFEVETRVTVADRLSRKLALHLRYESVLCVSAINDSSISFIDEAQNRATHSKFKSTAP